MLSPRATVAVTATALLTLLLPACGGGGPTGTGYQSPPPTGQQPPGQQPPGQQPSGSTTNAITVKGSAFDPTATTINAGTTVTWTWDACRDDGYGGSECTDHSVTFDDGTTSQVQSRGTFSRQFNAAGSYSYHCRVHASMTGQVTVR